jgi:hypothetical protein
MIKEKRLLLRLFCEGIFMETVEESEIREAWEAAASGRVEAKTRFAHIFLHSRRTFGSGIQRHIKIFHKQAVHWLHAAANERNTEAQFLLAMCHHTGKNAKHSSIEARRWFETAATRGHIEAQVYLAGYYHTGRGGPRNCKSAFLLCQRTLLRPVGDLNRVGSVKINELGAIWNDHIVERRKIDDRMMAKEKAAQLAGRLLQRARAERMPGSLAKIKVTFSDKTEITGSEEIFRKILKAAAKPGTRLYRRWHLLINHMPSS